MIAKKANQSLIVNIIDQNEIIYWESSSFK